MLAVLGAPAALGSSVQAPRRATSADTSSGRRVRTAVEVGGCERLLVPQRLLTRVVVWLVRLR
jgi:hypothetical protein